jgi:hypothetical protein
VISDKAHRVFIASLALGVISMGCAFVIMFIWPQRFWSIRFRGSTRTFGHQENATAVPTGIAVRILDRENYSSPIATISRNSFTDFWRLLDVGANAWSRFHLERQTGDHLPIALKFPLLSELADIEIDNIDFSADQIDELRAEINEVQESHVGSLQNGVLLALSNAAIVAAAQNKGLTLSPFG